MGLQSRELNSNPGCLGRKEEKKSRKSGVYLKPSFMLTLTYPYLYFGYFPFWSSSILVVFHFGRLPFRSSSISVVFHFGRLPFRSSSISVVFNFSRLPFRLSFIS